MNLKFDKLFLTIASEIAKLSHARRAQVGCVLVKEGNILSFGYNGMPSGMDNNCENELYANGELKFLETKPEVLHAETNAIAKLAKTGHSSLDATAYVTLSPCINCAKLLYQAGIKRVVYKQKHDGSDGVGFLEKVGVETYYWEDSLDV
jgi:dCMP deaminase